MLQAHGDFILPENVPANEFLNLEGQKLSTSKNWAVWLHEYLIDFPDQQDVLRYTLTANAPEAKDNDFTWKDFQARNNNELLAIYGNFINRVAVLTQKYYEGIVPTPGTFSEVDLEVLAEMRTYPQMIGASIERYKFKAASQELMQLARLGNKYLADEEPWKSIKTDPERTKTVLFVALQIAAALQVVSAPILPNTAQKLKTILKTPSWGWNDITDQPLLAPGHQLGEPVLLFRKIEDEEIQAQIDRLNNTKKDNLSETKKPVMPQKPACNFDTFSAIDLRVGTIIAAEKMPKADKLLVLQVQTGLDTRTIVSGIAAHFTPESLIGKRVTVLLNLEPRPLRGVVSEGMLLLTQDEQGQLVFVNPDQPGVADGAVIS